MLNVFNCDFGLYRTRIWL